MSYYVYLREICVGWRTVDAMASQVQEPKYLSFLVQHILSSSNGIEYNDDDTQLELIGMGAVAIRGDNIEASSPLIRAVLLNSVALTKKTCKHPVTNNNLLDVPALVRCVMELWIQFSTLYSWFVMQEYTSFRQQAHALRSSDIRQAQQYV